MSTRTNTEMNSSSVYVFGKKSYIIISCSPSQLSNDTNSGVASIKFTLELFLMKFPVRISKFRMKN